MKTMLILLLACTSWSGVCHAQETDKKYDNPDATNIYSTHPDRPFRYGYPYKRKEIYQRYQDHFEAYGIQAGDVVAEIGAASGWLEGVFSVFSDSVTYYVQDIDTNFLNRKQLDAVVEHFSKQRLTPQTNEFRLVLGTKTRTNLPDATFDLIIINNTFHEFTDVEVMVADLAKKLKPGGRVVVWESFSNYERKVRHGGCGIRAYTAGYVENLFSEVGLYLTKMEYPESSTINYLTFERDKQKADAYQEELREIFDVLYTLGSLSSKKTVRKQETMAMAEMLLLDDQEKLHLFFADIAPMLHDLADEYLKDKKANYAIEILELTEELYPGNPETPILLGDIYYDMAMFEEAREQYYEAIYRDTSDMYPWACAILASAETPYFELGFTDGMSALQVDSTDAYVYSSIGYLFRKMEEEGAWPYIFNLQRWKDPIVYEFDRDDVLLEAERAYTAAIVFDSLTPMYFTSRAAVYERMDMYNRAIIDYDYALYLNPYDLYVYRLRARAKRALGDEEGYEADIALMKEVRKGMKR